MKHLNELESNSSFFKLKMSIEVILIAVAIFFFSSFSAMAGETLGGFGVHMGANFSDYDLGNSTLNNAKSNRTGMLVGVHFEGFNFTDMFAMRLEGNYSVKGYSIGGVNVNHNYLQIPVLIKFMPMIGPVGVFAEAGPAASLHLSSSVDSGSLSVTNNTNDSNWDFSLIAGAGVSFKISPVVLELEARYDYGLKNLSNSSGVDVKSRAIQVLGGVTFLFL